MCTDKLETEGEKPRYNNLESGVNVSDGDHGTDDDDDDDDAKSYVVKSRRRVTSQVEETTQAAFGVKPCLDLVGAFEVAVELHNYQRRRKKNPMTVDE